MHTHHLPYSFKQFYVLQMHKIRALLIAKKICVCLIMLLSCFLSDGVSTPANAAKDQLQHVVLATGEWPPFTGQSLPEQGLLCKVIRDIFAESGVSVDIVFRPWQRAMEEARLGKVDGTFLWRTSPQREGLFYFSLPLIQTEVVFFHRKNTSFEWSELEDLKKYRFAGVIGLNYSEEFSQMEKDGDVSISRMPETQQMFRALLWSRIHAVPAIKESGYFTISQMFDAAIVNTLVHHPKPLAVHPLHFLAGRKHERGMEVVELFDKGLRALHDKAVRSEYTFPDMKLFSRPAKPASTAD